MSLYIYAVLFHFVTLVTDLKILAVIADPPVSRYHESGTMLAAMLQMNHYKIFLHRTNGLTELQKNRTNK
jgi:oligoribonuclease (3'-5' exoribonuclease)